MPLKRPVHRRFARLHDTLTKNRRKKNSGEITINRKTYYDVAKY